MLPAVFVSHGAPTLPLEDGATRRFLGGLGARLARPSAVLCVSAHWEQERPHVSTASRPETIHDFHGFPEALYRIRYPAPGAPEVAERARQLLEAAGIPVQTDPARGLDHGAWVPLLLMYPGGDVPALQLSVQPARGTREHVALGRALAPLREEDVLVLGSGGAVHDLRSFRPGSSAVPAWAAAFEDRLVAAVEAGDEAALVDYRGGDGLGARAHPSEEHFMPLLVAFGAGGGVPGSTLHRGFTHGGLSMAAFSFG
jgi:4,5-DOPA dioxygenase extradiol